MIPLGFVTFPPVSITYIETVIPQLRDDGLPRFDEGVSAMQEFADVTNAGNIPYTPTGQGVVGYNSNAYAFTRLESLGFERPRPVRPAPGWNQGRPSPSLTYGPYR